MIDHTMRGHDPPWAPCFPPYVGRRAHRTHAVHRAAHYMEWRSFTAFWCRSNDQVTVVERTQSFRVMP